MANEIVKKIGITGIPNDVRDIGAEAQNIEVSYDANDEVIVDIHEEGVVVDHTKSLTEALLGVNGIQFKEVPEASAVNKDKIIEYIGETSQDYINGYFYKCKKISELEYSWENIDVQPNGTQVSATVNGTSLSFTDNSITNDSIIDGPYIADVLVGLKAVSQSGITITYTLSNNSADGKNAYIYVR